METQTARYVVEGVAETGAEGLQRRLNTYHGWTSEKSSLQLATAGFIYTGITDKVECQACGIRLYNWQEDEDPLLAHKKYAGDCEFMIKNFPNVERPPKPKKILTVKYPHYSDYQTRLESFSSWPLKCVAQKPDMMARSGFFYIGSADRARCFHCGVTLRDWDTDDYPPCAHLQWSENCPYVQQIDVKGMKEEIEEYEREERLRKEWENSTFIDINPTERHGGGTIAMSDAEERQRLEQERQIHDQESKQRVEGEELLYSSMHNRAVTMTLQEYGYSLEQIRHAFIQLSLKDVKFTSVNAVNLIDENI